MVGIKSFLIGLISFVLLGIGFLALSFAAMFFSIPQDIQALSASIEKGLSPIALATLESQLPELSSTDVDFEQLKLACQNPELVAAASEETPEGDGDRMMQFNMKDICAKVSTGEVTDIIGFKTELSKDLTKPVTSALTSEFMPKALFLSSLFIPLVGVFIFLMIIALLFLFIDDWSFRNALRTLCFQSLILIIINLVLLGIAYFAFPAILSKISSSIAGPEVPVQLTEAISAAVGGASEVLRGALLRPVGMFAGLAVLSLLGIFLIPKKAIPKANSGAGVSKEISLG
ncbi:TPA: hypothetical protein HA238_02135 [Candidatus Micrarchaeota archaeon]|nr:hypothetical protein [Candidatus Micrarchaeota archaeon]